MKRFALLLASGLVILVVDASGFDSGAEQREDLLVQLSQYAERFAVMATPVSFEAAGLPAEILSPAFSANFVSLVVFAELGSNSVLEAIKSPVRGPPKSQRSNETNYAYPTANAGATLARKFSISTRTRLA